MKTQASVWQRHEFQCSAVCTRVRVQQYTIGIESSSGVHLPPPLHFYSPTHTPLAKPLVSFMSGYLKYFWQGMGTVRYGYLGLLPLGVSVLYVTPFYIYYH
jgi:hypothetical protein